MRKAAGRLRRRVAASVVVAVAVAMAPLLQRAAPVALDVLGARRWRGVAAAADLVRDLVRGREEPHDRAVAAVAVAVAADARGRRVQ